MPHTEVNSDQKFLLLQEIVLRIKKENPSLKDVDVIKKGVEDLHKKLELKNKSISAFNTDMKKIISENKKDGKNLFPSKNPSV